jgi:hypothetical protein
VVRRPRRELGGAGVDGLVHRTNAESVAHSPDHVGGHPPQPADLLVGEAVPLGPPQQGGSELVGVEDLESHLVDQQQLVDEPRVDRGGLEDLL